MDLGIEGQRAVICGASRGIGYGCADALARAGAQITLVARNPEKLQDAASRLESSHGTAPDVIAADLSTEAGCQTVLHAQPDTDILVTNCGGAPAGDFTRFTRQDWSDAVALNMLSALDLIRAYLPGMRERGQGRIVNILNIALQGGYPDLPLSSGATGGLASAIASLAPSAARDGVSINNILPGRFETERLSDNIAHDIATTGKSEAEVRATRLNRQAVQRFGNPQEIGALCAFLCSQHAGYVVGQNIAMDGGARPYEV
ncbi:SDR family oxidoreductase [Ruegeria sp.]|uniref:SDR family oxidoreductase n=1 Tax=Ruegeria sp. TaxID=1879320 RepID=UPI0023186DB7|nr:SDR family oxidoreductase [Ruegeria sp.]MDA7965560.1 SDR family oxidoreductase [Ruegeria sp.]